MAQPSRPPVDDVWGDSDNIEYNPKLEAVAVPATVKTATDDPLAGACLVYELPRQKVSAPVKVAPTPPVRQPAKNGVNATGKKKKRFAKFIGKIADGLSDLSDILHPDD
jgi:hypothetical protein